MPLGATVFGLLLLTGAVRAQTPSTQVSRPIKLEIESPGTAYVGLPLLLAMTIRNDGGQPLDLPVWDAMGAHPPVTLVAEGKDGRSYTCRPTRFAFVQDEVETTGGPRPIMRKQWSLQPGDSFRCVVNLGWNLKEQVGLQPGEYRVRFVLWRKLGEIAAESKVVTLTMANPPDDQMKRLLAKVVVDSTGTSTKKGVTVSPTDFGNIGQPELRSTLAFAFLMEEAALAQDAVDVPVADYDKMIEPYLLSEVRMLEWVCLRARQQKDRADEVRSQLIDRYPSMRSRMALAEKDRSFLRLSRPLSDGLKALGTGEKAGSQPSR